MKLMFDEVEKALKLHSWSIDAAEFHGMLSGLICAGVEDDDIDNWLPVLIGERYLTEEEYKPIEFDVLDAYFEVRSNLDTDGFEFQVLLPDESQSLERRVRSMSSWCKGFLLTLIEYGETEVDELSEDCSEFVLDLQQIADLEIDEDEPEDELDIAYLTIEEHLRVGVQLIYEYINPYRNPDGEAEGVLSA